MLLVSKYFLKSPSRSLIFCSLVTVQSYYPFFGLDFDGLAFLRVANLNSWTYSDFRSRVRFWKDLLAECSSDSPDGECHLSIKFPRSGVTTYSSVVSAPQPTTKGRPCLLKFSKLLRCFVSWQDTKCPILFLVHL